MNWSEDLVMVGLANAAILDEQVLGILWEVRSQEDTEGRGTVGLKGSGVFLRISEPSEVGTVELDVLRGDGERVVLRMSWVEGNLCGLDLRDDVEWSVVGADAEGDRELAAASEGMDSKGRVTGGNEDRSFIREPSRSEVGSSFEVRQESNAFDEITLSWLNVVGAGHDDSKLDLEAEL